MPDASHTSVAPASVALRLVGLLRWEAARFPCLPKAYQAIARIGVALPAVAFFLLALLPALAPTSFADGYRERCDASTCWRHVFLSQLPLPIGAVLVLMPLGCRRDQQRLEESLTLVRGLSVERGYGIVEARRRRFDSLVYILMCLGSMAAAGAGDGFAPSAAMRAFHASAIGVFSAVILCLSYAIVCICRSLIVMVDAFCCDVVGAMPLENVAHFWNLTQALRAAGRGSECELPSRLGQGVGRPSSTPHLHGKWRCFVQLRARCGQLRPDCRETRPSGLLFPASLGRLEEALRSSWPPACEHRRCSGRPPSMSRSACWRCVGLSRSPYLCWLLMWRCSVPVLPIFFPDSSSRAASSTCSWSPRRSRRSVGGSWGAHVWGSAPGVRCGRSHFHPRSGSPRSRRDLVLLLGVSQGSRFEGF